MLETIDLTALLSAHGTEVARVDDTAYLALPAIYACANGSAPVFYCVVSDWQTTPAHRIAELYRINTELAVRVAELEAQLTTPSETPAQNQERQFAAQHAALDVPDPGPCPECGKAGWKSGPALKMHRQRAHQGLVARNGKAALIEPDHGWRCNEPGCAGAFTRSISSPDYCTLHAPAHANSNGVLANG